MKIIVLGVPHTQTTSAFSTCPFTTKARNLCRMMHRRGHEVIHIGVEGSDPECSRHVSIVAEPDWVALFGEPTTEQYKTPTGEKHRQYFAQFAKNMREAIEACVGRRWEAIVCSTWGGPHENATKGLKQFVVGSGIGYRRTWAKYRVFISYAWLHFHWGLERRVAGDRWYDVVIPNPVDPDLFDFRPQDKQDYLLFMGRLNDDKGVKIAIDVCERAGRALKIVGQGDPAKFLKGNSHVEYIPPVGVEGRRKLMAEAAALCCPTQYVEPLGNVALEAQLSGTPVISTDWGGVTETVLHGQTGYRCRTFDQFVWAARNIHRIDPQACRNWVLANYAPEKIATMFEEYFQSLLDLDRDGWYATHPDRQHLNWLRKSFPGTEADPVDPESPVESTSSADDEDRAG